MQPVPIESAAAQWTLLVLTLLLATMMLSAAFRYVRRLSQRQTQDLTSKINDLLPQTQCGRCSFEGCLPYAAAIADGEAINKCPPGGADLIYRLGKLLHENPQGLDPRHGSFTPAQVAVIREDECIGCTKCIRACPVDAILGGPKLMHTVIEAECTGCDLCLEPCPVDCIDLLPLHEARQAPQQYGSTLSSGGVSC